MAEEIEKETPFAGNRNRIGKLRQALMIIGRTGDDKPILPSELSDALGPLMDMIGEQNDMLESHSGKLLDHDKMWETYKQSQRHERNMATWFRALEGSENRDLIMSAAAYLGDKVFSSYSDRGKAEAALNRIMDDLIDLCTEHGVSPLSAVMEAAESAGFTPPEAKQVAEAAKNDAQNPEKVEENRAEEDKDKPLDKEGGADDAEEEEEGQGADANIRFKMTDNENLDGSERKEQDNPDAIAVIAKARRTPDNGRPSSKGRMSGEELSRLAKEDPPRYRRYIEGR